MERKIEIGIPGVRQSTHLNFEIPDVFSSGDQSVDQGKNWVRYEYEAHVNKPELVRLTVVDPHNTIFDEYMTKFYERAVEYQKHPLMMYTRALWVPAEEPQLKLEHKVHAVSSIQRVPGKRGSDMTLLTFNGISLPHYLLAGGDAGGYTYTGRLSDVLRDVCNKYNRGLFSTEVKAETRDDKHNKWYQNRLDPLSFIRSLLRWSTPLLEKKSRWIWYADTNKSEPNRMVFQEERGDKSLHRATYHWLGAAPSFGHGDIEGFELLADNSWDLRHGKLVTSGLSTMAGSYHDRIVHKEQKDAVYIDELNTRTKNAPNQKPKEALRQPDTDLPLDVPIGWTSSVSIPEWSGGEIGLNYTDYMDGYARGQYYESGQSLQRIALRVTGHHIWSESRGLGYDTIDIKWLTKYGTHSLHGNWIVDGFKHIVERGTWKTTLYCHRLHANAIGVKTGKQIVTRVTPTRA